MTGDTPMPADPRPRMPAWQADVLAVAIMAALTYAPTPGEPYSPPSAAAIVFSAGVAVILLVRRRRPVLVLAATASAYAVAAFVGAVTAGLAVGVAIAAFTATNRSRRRTGLIATATTIVLLLSVGWLTTIGSAWDPRVIQNALAVGFAAAAGDATKLRRDYVAAVTERAVRAEETRDAEAQRRVMEERLRIARDLHDAVAHQMAVISLNAGVASSSIDSRPEKAKESLTTIRGAARTVLREIQDLLLLLRSDDDIAPTAPPVGLDGLDDLVHRFDLAGLDVTLRVEGDLTRVSGPIGIVAYRVVQESLTNTHKHGAEHRAHVLLSAQDETLTIVVTNPAVAGDEPGPGARLGLTGLRERVGAVRGTIDVGPAPGGWRVRVRLPLARDEPS